ncbi:MAG: MFS transporter [Alphaproteobacteria bacterium]|nr:MFS transporter [Alphaproteobacteria bacterium]
MARSSTEGGDSARRLASDTISEPVDEAALAPAGWAGWLYKPAGTSATGGPIASRLGQVSWAMFECARIPYVLLVTIYLFGPYFTRHVFSDPVQGQSVWAAISSWGGIATAVAAPFLGAIADNGGRRKPWIFVYTVMMVASMLAMWVATPHAPVGTLWLIAIAIIVANFSYEFSSVFHNAMLPTIAPHDRVGPLSGLGLSLGNLAGIILLGFMFVAFSAPGNLHWFFIPDHPLFGISRELHTPERLTGPISGIWLAIFALPLFLFTPDKPSTGIPVRRQMALGVRAVWSTIKSLRHYRNIGMYLIARIFFNDGMGAVLLFGGIYAASTFDWEPLAMMTYGLELSVFAVLGGFVGGWLDNRLGSKRAIFVSVGGTLLFFCLSLTFAPDRMFWFIPYDVHAAPINDLPFFNTWPQVIYLLIVNGVAVLITAGYANARTMMARIAPAEKMTEFFGLMSLSGTAATPFANGAVSIMTAWTMSQRGGLLPIIGFLGVGILLMFFVKEERAVVPD